MTKFIFILLGALVLEALGVVYLKIGLTQIGEPQRFTLAEIGRLVGRGATNPSILLGVLMETIFFIALLVLLKYWDVSLVWPLTSLGFVISTLAARYIRHEEVSALRWAGVFLIMAGAVMVGYSERLKTPEAGKPDAPQVSKE